MKKWKSFALSVLWLAVLLGLLAGCTTGQSSGPAFSFEKGKVERGDLVAYVVASGVIQPKRALQLTWKIEGQVETVSTGPLQPVAAGQELARLRESSLPTSVMSARLDLLEAQQALEKLQDNRTAVEQARLDLLAAKEAYEKAEQNLVNVSGDRRYISEAYIDGVRAEVMMAETAVEIAQNSYDHLAGRPDNDPDKAVALKNLSEKKQALARAKANLNYVLGTPTSKEIEQAQVELALAEAKLADAQRTLERIENGPPPDELVAIETRIAIAQAIIDQAVLTAPFDGIVTSIQVQPGDVVQPGTVALTIEDQSSMYITGQVSEMDINRLSVGQLVEINLDAIYGTTYYGKIIEIGGSGESQQGVVNFPVRIEMASRDDAVRSGMTAMLRVMAEEVKDALLVPNAAVRVLDGERVVYVDRGKPLPEPVTIQLGVSSETMSQVLSGDLKEGDTIILNPDMLVEMGMSISISP